MCCGICRTCAEDAAGKLSLDQLGLGQPMFKEAVSAGLHWTTLHWQTERVFPDLVPLVVAALNTRAATNETEIEVMLGMHHQRDQMSRAGVDPDWTAIQRQALMGMPSCGSYIDGLVKYVQAQAPELMAELNLFVKAFAAADAGSNRTLGAEFLTKVAAGLQPSKAERYPHVMHAAVCTNLQSPKNKVIDGLCRFLAPSNISSLMAPKKRSGVKDAENLMYQARQLCKVTAGLTEAMRVKCLGRLDVRIICFLCDKKQLENKTFEALTDIMQVAVALLL